MAQSNLRHGALSTFDTVGQSIAMNGPAATVSLYLVALASFSGFNMTFVLLVSFIIYVAITYVIYQWSKIVDSPAPWMKYASMGLGNGVGFVSGWIYWIYYIVGFGGFGLLGISAFLNSLGGVMQYRWLWYVVVIVMTVEALIIVLRRVELSTRYFIVMGLVEILFLVATSLLLLWLFRTNLHYVSSMNISSIKPLALFGPRTILCANELRMITQPISKREISIESGTLRVGLFVSDDSGVSPLIPPNAPRPRMRASGLIEDIFIELT